MATKSIEVKTAAEIRGLVDHWLKAVLGGDVDAIMSHYAPDLVAFDAVSALRFHGREAYGKHWRACLDMCPGPMIFEIHDLTVTSGDDVAFCHYLCRCGAQDANGTEKTSWMRATVCFQKANGWWLIVHEHFSAPFDMASGKALFDLQP